MRLHEKGLVYRGSYLVNWSPNLQTAVSDLEVTPLRPWQRSAFFTGGVSMHVVRRSSEDRAKYRGRVILQRQSCKELACLGHAAAVVQPGRLAGPIVTGQGLLRANHCWHVRGHQVDYTEDPGTMYFFRYPVADSEEHLPVATTRPETILGDTAVAVHPQAGPAARS